jgi:hypothetical protein
LPPTSGSPLSSLQWVHDTKSWCDVPKADHVKALSELQWVHDTKSWCDTAKDWEGTIFIKLQWVHDTKSWCDPGVMSHRGLLASLQWVHDTKSWCDPCGRNAAGHPGELQWVHDTKSWCDPVRRRTCGARQSFNGSTIRNRGVTLSLELVNLVNQVRPVLRTPVSWMQFYLSKSLKTTQPRETTDVRTPWDLFSIIGPPHSLSSTKNR